MVLYKYCILFYFIIIVLCTGFSSRALVATLDMLVSWKSWPVLRVESINMIPWQITFEYMIVFLCVSVCLFLSVMQGTDMFVSFWYPFYSVHFLLSAFKGQTWFILSISFCQCTGARYVSFCPRKGPYAAFYNDSTTLVCCFILLASCISVTNIHQYWCHWFNNM